MTQEQVEERRRFSRIPSNAFAHVKTGHEDLYLNCPVIDVSLKGLLITKPEHWQPQLNEACHIDLVLEEGQIVIEMKSIVAHIRDDMIGLSCEQIDLDSISHLKRLVELNLGDDALLHRELSALFNS